MMRMGKLEKIKEEMSKGKEDMQGLRDKIM
jgi:hypothetical protein